MTRFLHTADWQLGMTRHYFSEGVQERYAQARFDAIRRLGKIAQEQGCCFLVVCGDVFESNHVDRQVVSRTCEALAGIRVPVYILPGNHDPLDAASVYRSNAFVDRCPPNVHVIDSVEPRTVAERVELIGAPWLSKRPAVNPLEELLSKTQPVDDSIRILVGHGILDRFTPDKDAPGLIAAATLDNAVSDGRASFIALGDRHSVTQVGSTGRVWYSGTPEATDFREDRSGYALVVEVEGEHVATREVEVGQWKFVEHTAELNSSVDISHFAQVVRAIEIKERVILRLRLSGVLSVTLHADLQRILQESGELFGACDLRDDNLRMMPEDADFTNRPFSGFAEKTITSLRDQIGLGGTDAEVAQEALLLLFRLAESSK